jgi:hypothetical protein
LDKDLLHLIAMTTIGAIGSLAATVYATFVKKGEVLPRRQLAPHSSADLNTASKKKLL